MSLFGHHAKGFLQSIGLDIDINDNPWPDTATEHVVATVLLLLLAYGAFAIVRDLFRWRRRAAAKIATHTKA